RIQLRYDYHELRSRRPGRRADPIGLARQLKLSAKSSPVHWPRTPVVQTVPPWRPPDVNPLLESSPKAPWPRRSPLIRCPAPRLADRNEELRPICLSSLSLLSEPFSNHWRQ